MNAIRLTQAAAIASLCLSASFSMASSHREAPFITENPKVDGTDFYMFRSYEPGRQDFVTIVANYFPLQDPFGGPNYFDMDPNAIYEIHLDNTGNAQEDITFRFKFSDVLTDLQIPVGGEMVSVPLKNIGGIGPGADDVGNVSFRQTYEASIVRGDRRGGQIDPISNTADGSTVFPKPLDNIGAKSFSDYQTYANNHIFDIAIPGCSAAGRMFVGQRKESFAVNLGEVFDLVNLNPLGPRGVKENVIGDKNITTLAVEVPISCVTAPGEPVIGGWTTSSVRQARVVNPTPTPSSRGAAIHGGAFTQVSRLGMPLVNEVVIGLKDKDLFNASKPVNDSQFAQYVTNPTLPALLEILFASAGAQAPDMFPRTDLVAVFLTGVEGLNQPTMVTPSEMLRLNTSIDPTPMGSQETFGVLAGDLAGFPNGRRPGDDVVDAALRVVMGALIEDPAIAPNREAPFTDGVAISAADFDNAFPYLKTPLGGSPQ